MKINIPTAVTDAEIEYLQELAWNMAVLEFGSLLGYSTVKMAMVAKSVVAVDPHNGYPENNPQPTLLQFLKNLEHYGVRDKVMPVVAKGNDIIPFLNPNFHLIFIDTMGDEFGTYCLMQQSATFLQPTYLAVHDYGRTTPWDCSGVNRAVNRFKLIEQDWFVYHLVDTLVVLKRNK